MLGYTACEPFSSCGQVSTGRGSRLVPQSLTISMTILISNGWPGRWRVADLGPWASGSLPSSLLSGLCCGPGWPSVPVSVASACVRCPDCDPTLSCSILLKRLTLSPSLGGDIVALPHGFRPWASRAPSHPGLAVDRPTHRLNPRGLGCPGGTSYLPQKTILLGEYKEPHNM